MLARIRKSRTISQYADRWFPGDVEEYRRSLEKTSTVYIGNLDFGVNELQLYEKFVCAGRIEKIIMGLDRYTYKPCGFCFIQYSTHEEAINSVVFLNRTKLDGRVIRVDLDAGYVAGREYGRGSKGGQVRDEHRTYTDEGRGDRKRSRRC